MTAHFDLEQATEAKATFMRFYDSHPYINGVGLTRFGEGWAIKVNVSKRTAIVPRSCNGVPIVREYAGEIVAQASL